MPNNRLHQPHVPLPEIHWSPNEQWVWRKLRRGERADFNERYGVELVAWEDEAWNEEEKARRLIRPEFLYTVLLHEPWRGALSNWGVRIGGAIFSERIRMPEAKVAQEFGLKGCRLERGLLFYGARFAHRLFLLGCYVRGRANLQNVHSGGNLVLDKCRLGEIRFNDARIGGNFSASQAKFRGDLAMDRTQVQGSLFMRKTRFEGDVRMLSVRVDGQVSMKEAAFSAKLNMEGAKIRGSLFMGQGRFAGEVRLLGLAIGDRFNTKGASFTERLSMEGAKIKGNFFMRENTFGKEVRFHGVKTDGSISMNDASFAGRLAMDGAEIKGSLFMRDCTFHEDVRLHGVRTDGSVSMSNAVFTGKLQMQHTEVLGGLFLRDAEFASMAKISIIFSKIGGNIHFERAEIHFLDLTGTKVRAIVDNGMKWPDKLKLDHLTYQHLGGLGEGYGGVHMLDRPASWFAKEWLAKHKPYSPQPYEQCAKVLRESGQPGKAKEVLYQGKERERNEPNGDFRRWVWLTASKWLLGHGLTWRFALVPAAWAVGVLLLGWLIFCQTTTLMENHSPWWGLGYSLSRLIPLVSFGKDLSELGVSSFAARAWFTFQTLFGWFLASLIVAGLAGVGRPARKS